MDSQVFYDTFLRSDLSGSDFEGFEASSNGDDDTVAADNLQSNIGLGNDFVF